MLGEETRNKRLTKTIFLSLIENNYYKDNNELTSLIKKSKAFLSSISLDKDGEIEQKEDPFTTQENFFTTMNFEDEDEEDDYKDRENEKKSMFNTKKSIFEDLNYGDFALICPNPLYHYQIPERIRSLENFIKKNKELGKKKNLPKEVKLWLKELKKNEGINLEHIKIDALFSKYNTKGNQVLDQGEVDDNVIKHLDIKQVKSSVESQKPENAWISVEKANEIYDLCLGSNRGTYFGDGRGDDSYYGLKDLDM